VQASRSFLTSSSITPPKATIAGHTEFSRPDNGAYYILEPDRSRYANYSGAGNTLNTNHPVVRRMIVDSLRYWWKRCMWMAFGSIWHRFSAAMSRGA